MVMRGYAAAYAALVFTLTDLVERATERRNSRGASSLRQDHSSKWSSHRSRTLTLQTRHHRRDTRAMPDSQALYVLFSDKDHGMTGLPRSPALRDHLTLSLV